MAEKEYEVVYEEAIRALDIQRAAFDALRTRTGILLSAGAVATSFLGGREFAQDQESVWSWLAVGLFLAFGAASLKVLWPRAEGSEGFTAVPSLVIEEYLESDDPVDLATLYRDLALHAEDAHDVNKVHHLLQLTRYFRAAVVLLTLEVTAWVVALATG